MSVLVPHGNVSGVNDAFLPESVTAGPAAVPSAKVKELIHSIG